MPRPLIIKPTENLGVVTVTGLLFFLTLLWKFSKTGKHFNKLMELVEKYLD